VLGLRTRVDAHAIEAEMTEWAFILLVRTIPGLELLMVNEMPLLKGEVISQRAYALGYEGLVVGVTREIVDVFDSEADILMYLDESLKEVQSGVRPAITREAYEEMLRLAKEHEDEANEAG
jgi:hypothetical protein